jgi:hypothetical protein
MTTKDLTPHIEEIKLLYLDLLWKAEDIGNKFGIRADLFRAFLSRHGVRRGYRLPSPFKRTFTEEERRDIVFLYTSKTMTTHLVAKKYNCSRPTIRKVLKAEKVTFLTRANASRKSMLKDDFFDKIDSPAKATLLGLIAADGHNNEQNSIVITLQYGDIEYLRRFSFLVYGEDKVKTRFNLRNGKKLKHCTLYLFSKRYTEVLKAMGISRNKTKNLRWPTGIPKRFAIDFIRGFFDGDGCVYLGERTHKARYKNTVYVYRSVVCGVYFCGTKGMMLDIQRILQKKDIRSNLNWCGKNNQTLWKLTIGRNEDKLRLLGKIYQDKEYALDRKYAKFQEVKKALAEQKSYVKIGRYSLDR